MGGEAVAARRGVSVIGSHIRVLRDWGFRFQNCIGIGIGVGVLGFFMNIGLIAILSP